MKVIHLKRFYNQLEDNGISLHTIKDINTRIKPSLSESERQEFISKNATKLVTLNQPDKVDEVKILSSDEQIRFLMLIIRKKFKCGVNVG